MSRTTLVTLVSVLCLPTLASAQVSVGMRASYGIPAGDAYEQSGFGTFKQKDLAKGQVPLQLDATWRFSPALSAGLYIAYGFGAAGSKLKDFCSTGGASCDRPNTLRYGVQGAYSFSQAGRADPWLGLSAGVESASFAVKNFDYGIGQGAPPGVATGDLDGTLRGWDAAVEGGFDHRIASDVAVGPYLSYGVGQYRVEDVTIGGLGTVAAGGVDNAKTHQWLTFGVRGRFDL